MRSGQKKAHRKSSFFYNKFQRTLIPHQYLEKKLVELEKLSKNKRDLWKIFQKYLEEEREKVLEQIKYALLQSSESDYSEEAFGRIVNSEFSSTPLSCQGSYLSPPGGRFNFGQSISYRNYFPALYLSDGYDTAFCEKFRFKKSISEEISSEEFALRKPKSFSYQRVRFSLERIMDLTTDLPIDAFFEEIKHIKMPKKLKQDFKNLGENVVMIRSKDHLRQSIMEENYEQWDYWLDCPSNSQWLGHYARLAGIQGILYPSVRMESRVNIAIFPDQFGDSLSYVELVDKSDLVPLKQMRMDSSNFNDFL